MSLGAISSSVSVARLDVEHSHAWIPSLAASHENLPEQVIAEALYVTTACLVIPHLAHDIDGEA